MISLLQTLQIVSAFLTILLVQLHSAKGEGLGSIGSSAQMFSSNSKVEKTLNVMTWIFGLMFLTCSAILSWKLIK